LFSWSRFGDEDAATTLQHMFKFYEPGVENSGDANHLNHWWLWEKMVWENVIGGEFRSITDWWKIDGEAYEFLHKEYNGFCLEELCLIDYFACMLGKWFPYYNKAEAIKKYIEFNSITGFSHTHHPLLTNLITTDQI